jgi:chorismate mutase / prephenate dehydratase
MAARQLYTERADWIAASTIDAVFRSVADGGAEAGIVPIENSTEGSVALTLDCLLESDRRIHREHVLEVVHCLVARHADLARFSRVLSHPQALAQCRGWLGRELRSAEMAIASSTAQAACEAARDDATAAIASRLAAELCGLRIVAEGIQDRRRNMTRFVVVGHSDAPRSGRDRTSIVFSLPHEQGALMRALEVFTRAGINLTRIESRPLPGKLWEYLFFADFEGHQSDAATAAALQALSHVSGRLQILGSYPRAF